MSDRKVLWVLLGFSIGLSSFAQKVSFELQTAHTSQIKSLYLSPDNQVLFSTASNETAIYVWQTKTGKKIKTLYSNAGFALGISSFLDSTTLSSGLKEQAKQELSVSIGPNIGQSSVVVGDTTFTVYEMGMMMFYKNKDGKFTSKLIFDQGTLKKHTHVLLLSRNEKKLIVSTTTGDVTIVNFKGKKLKAFKFGKSAVTSLYLSNNKELLIVGNALGEVAVLNIITGELVSRCSGVNKPIERIYYSKDGNTLYIIRGNELITYNYYNNISKRLNTRENMLSASIDSISGDSVVILSYLKNQSRFSGRWNMLKNTFQTKEVAFAGSSGYTFGDYVNAIKQFADSFNGIEVSCAYMGATQFSIKKINSEMQAINTGNSTPITALKINKVYKYVSVAHVDGKITHWDLSDGKQLFTSIILNTNTYIHLLPNGYYYGSKQIFNSLNCVQGIKILPNFQMDAEYNRPDQVIKHIPQHDSLLAAAIEHSYQKRKRNNTSSKMSDSEIIVTADKVESKDGFVVLKLKVKATGSTIKKISFFVNGVDEKLLVGAGKNEFETTHSVELANGENKIEVFAQDNSGSFSNKVQFSEKNKIKVKPNLYLVCIGSAKFAESGKNLNYANKDAMDVYNLLSKSKMYRQINKMLFLDQQVTNTITSDIEKLLSTASKNDVVMLFYAGHGILNKDLDYYLSTYNVDFMHPEEKGIPYEKVEAILEACPARQKLFFIDACHSGDVEKNEAKQIETRGSDTIRGITFRSGTSNTGLSQNELSLMLSKELFASGSNSSGTSIIGASMGSQYALESNKWNNGVFTYSLLTGLGKRKADYNQDNKIMLEELQYYVNKNVEELTGGKQKPTTRTENLIGNIRIR